MRLPGESKIFGRVGACALGRTAVWTRGARVSCTPAAVGRPGRVAHRLAAYPRDRTAPALRICIRTTRTTALTVREPAFCPSDCGITEPLYAAGEATFDAVRRPGQWFGRSGAYRIDRTCSGHRGDVRMSPYDAVLASKRAFLRCFLHATQRELPSHNGHSSVQVQCARTHKPTISRSGAANAFQRLLRL